MVNTFDVRSALSMLAESSNYSWYSWVLPRWCAVEAALDERDALKTECDILKAGRDELLSALKMARQDIENTRNIFLTYSLDRKFYDNLVAYDNLISKYEEKDNDN